MDEHEIMSFIYKMSNDTILKIWDTLTQDLNTLTMQGKEDTPEYQLIKNVEARLFWYVVLRI